MPELLTAILPLAETEMGPIFFTSGENNYIKQNSRNESLYWNISILFYEDLLYMLFSCESMAVASQNLACKLAWACVVCLVQLPANRL